MRNWGILLLSYFIITFILFRLSLFIDITYSRKGSDDRLVIDVYIWRRFLAYRIEIPVIEITKRRGITWVESELETSKDESETNAADEKKQVWRSILLYVRHPERIRKVLRNIRDVLKKYKTIMHRMNQHVECQRFYWKTRLGTDDAALTGSLVGILWLIKTYVLCDMSTRCHVKTKPFIFVEPLFDRTDFEINFQCIFSIRLGHIITTSVNAFFISFKGGTGRG